MIRFFAIERMHNREVEGYSGFVIESSIDFIALGAEKSIVSTEVMFCKFQKLYKQYKKVTGKEIHVTQHI